MNIALDAKRAYHNQRGLGNYSRDVIRLLSGYAQGHSYYLMGKPSDRYNFAGCKNIAPHGIYRNLPALYRSFGEVGDLRGMDLYWGLSGELPFGIARVKGLRKIVTIHDAIFIRYPELYSATYRWMFTQKVKYACGVADKIIAISEQTRRDVVEFFGADEEKIEVVYQGCNNIFREEVKPASLQKLEGYVLPKEFILDVGAIEPRKNLGGLIEAVSISGLDLPIVAIGGSSKYAEEMRKLSIAKGVRLRIIHGFPYELLPALYKRAMVFAYPSIFEGFGIPILEAMCVGTPVLTSKGSCFAETGGDAAMYADPHNAEEMGCVLRKIVEDSELRERMIRLGHIQSERFRDDVVAKNIINAIL